MSGMEEDQPGPWDYASNVLNFERQEAGFLNAIYNGFQEKSLMTTQSDEEPFLSNPGVSHTLRFSSELLFSSGSDTLQSLLTSSSPTLVSTCSASSSPPNPISSTKMRRPVLTNPGPPKSFPEPQERKPQAPPKPSPLQFSSQILPSWRQRDTLAIKLTNVPKEASAVNLWEAFQKEGSIFTIDLFEDSHGNRKPEGKIRFKSALAFNIVSTCAYTCIDHPRRQISGRQEPTR